MAVVVVAVFWVVLSSTRYGRYIYATGANGDVARLSGIRRGWMVASAFVLTAGAAAFAGLPNASKSMSAQASDDFSSSSAPSLPSWWAARRSPVVRERSGGRSPARCSSR